MKKIILAAFSLAVLSAVPALAQSQPNPTCGVGFHYDSIQHACVVNTQK